jgi:hypothetical protein
MYLPPIPPDTFEMLVATVNKKLVEVLDPEDQISDNPDLAPHQRNFLREAIWPQGLDAFLKSYIPCAAPQVRNLKRASDELFKEQNLPVVKLVLRRSLAGKHCSLTELAGHIYDPRSDSFSRYRELIKDRLLDELAEIQVWTYDKILATSRISGRDYVAGYKITAGASLLLFHTHIYMYWRHRQDRWFRNN